MLRRPQRTEDAQRLEARTARTFAAPLRAGVSENNGPARSRRKPLRLKREDGAYRRRCFRSRSTARALRSGTGRAAQQCTRRARGTGVVHSQATRLAAAMGHASIGPAGGNVL